MKLIIVESPTKAKTISTFLGKEYQIIATMGHIRDLPKSELGVDVENNFEPKYVIPLKARKTIGLLKKESEKADLIILATDEDREGEAIAWHITQILNLDNVKCQMSNVKCQNRIVFHEITKTAIEEAIKNPRSIDSALVDAQQARRVLDRIVGYKLSPFLWKKVARRLSAGRVQSAAVKLVCDREEEIKKFIPQEHWTIVASLLKIKNQIAKIKNNEFEAILVKKNGKIIPKLGIESKEQAEKILEELKGAEYKIISIEKKEVKRNPLPPFTTSSLQQESWQKFHWPAKLTMGIAQNLYEHGLITYHRTDSLNLSSQALGAAKNFIKTNFGENYAAGFLRNFKTKSKGAQEAHEAIRPTVPEKTPENTKNNLEAKQQKLYDLIWRRFIACQMSQAIFDSTAVEIEAGNSKATLRGVSSFGRSSKINPMGSPSKSVQQNNYIFRANGQILKFDGFLKVYPIKFKETELPGCEKDEILELIKLIPFQHFTQPPARYTEASLIKALEENGIGRPSTYAPILFTIQARNYVEKNEDKKFQPTEIGTVVNEVLTIHFPEIVDIKFTAQMEEKLDEIALGKEKWTAVIKEFYEPFEENLQKKYQEVSKKEIAEQETEEKCPKCGANLLIKLGRFGKFYACSGFPKCKFAKSLKKSEINIKCPKCKTGLITEKRTKKGKIFYGCALYPECDFALWDKPINDFCPKCNSILIQTKRKQIYPVKSSQGEVFAKGEQFNRVNPVKSVEGSVASKTQQFNWVKCSNKECDFKKNT